MFPLPAGSLPDSTARFAEALQRGLEPIGVAPTAVELQGEFPHFARLAIDLSGAKLPLAIPPTAGPNATEPVVTVEQWRAGGTGMQLGDARFDGHLEAEAATLVCAPATTAGGQPSLSLRGAGAGSLALEISRPQLEILFLQIARRAGAKQGVGIDAVQLTLQQRGPSTVGLEAKVTATKMILKIVVRLTGELTIDPDLRVTARQLTCASDGFAGQMACHAIEPILARFENRTFSLPIPASSQLQWRDVALIAGDSVKIAAKFTSQPAAEAG